MEELIVAKLADADGCACPLAILNAVSGDKNLDPRLALVVERLRASIGPCARAGGDCKCQNCLTQGRGQIGNRECASPRIHQVERLRELRRSEPIKNSAPRPAALRDSAGTGNGSVRSFVARSLPIYESRDSGCGVGLLTGEDVAVDVECESD